MIKANTKHFSLSMMCRLLSVSHSGYYGWRDRKPSARSRADTDLSSQIKVIYDKEKVRVGAIRITKRLKAQGVAVGRHRVARLMRLHGWRAKAARKYKATTNSHHKLAVAPNLLQQDFTARYPNEKWVSDITYI